MVGVVRVRRLLIMTCLAAALSACEISPEEKALQACSVLCTCKEAPLPAIQDRCVTKCTDELETSNVSDACVACVTANGDHCSTLENICEPICDPPMPVDDGGNGV